MDDVDVPILEAVDSVFMPNCVTYREHETNQESLDCTEHIE